MSAQTIGFIGAGNMARSLAGGLLANGWSAQQLLLADPDPGQRRGAEQALGLKAFDDNRAVAAGAGPTQFEGTASGAWHAPLRLKARLWGAGLDVDAEGTAEPWSKNGAGESKSSVSLRVRSADISPLLNLKSSDPAANIRLSSRVTLAGDRLTFDDLDSIVAGSRLRGRLALTLARCDGVCATRLIKAELPGCKVVMLTISEDEQDLFEAVKSGASGYLLKRVDATHFFLYLNELQDGHPPFSPGLAEKILKEFSHQAVRAETQTAQSNSIAAQAGPGRANESQGIPLSSRQVQILTLVAQGQTYNQVPQTIGITERTVKYHMAEILDRLHLQTRAEVIAYAAQSGLVPRPRGEEEMAEAMEQSSRIQNDISMSKTVLPLISRFKTSFYNRSMGRESSSW